MPRSSNFSGRGFGELPVGLEFFADRKQIVLRAFQFGRSSGGTRVQLRAAFFIGRQAPGGSLGFNVKRVDSLAVLRDFACNGIAALGALRMLAFARAHRFCAGTDFFGHVLERRMQRRLLPAHLRELAGQHDFQLLAHFIAQASVALGLRRLALE